MPSSSPHRHAPHSHRSLSVKHLSRSLSSWVIVALIAGSALLAACGDQPLPAAPEAAQPTASLAASPTPAPLLMQPQPVATIEIQPDGQAHRDEYGGQIIAAADAFAETDMLSVTVSNLGGPLAAALQEQAVIETPLYAITALHDSRDRIMLSLPAASPESRLVALINNEFLAVLAQEPQQGRLQVDVWATPKEAPPQTPGRGRDGSIQYFVARPAASATDHPAIWAAIAPPVVAAADRYDSCLTWTTSSMCRTNGWIYVTWRLGTQVTTAQADAVINQVETILNAFAARNVKAAANKHYLFIVINPSLTAPAYSPISGILSLPVDSAQTIASPDGQHELIHELFHWIQDKTYAMTIAALVEARTWWLEMTAENAVFLIDPAAQSQNLTQYGQTTVKGATLGFQAAPLTWSSGEEARYIHAQLLKVNLCASSACPLSEASMIAAINDGVYPFADEAALSLLRSNLDDYARYLLGSPPLRANPALTLPEATQKPGQFGDVIWVKSGRASMFELETSSTPPQIQKETPAQRPPEYRIQAAIEPGGVYPLSVISGGSNGTGRPGWPVMVTIEPGVPLLYRLNEEAVAYHDGATALVLGPIHRSLGYESARIVALAPTEAVVFKAAVAIVDLSGDWMLVSRRVNSNSYTCTGDAAADDVSDAEELIQLTQGLSVLVAQRGSYQWSDLNELTFAFEAGPSSVTGEADDPSQFTALAMIGPDNIQGMMRIEIPQPEAHQAHPAWLWLIFLPPSALAWRARRRIAFLCCMLGLSVALAGCVGITISGSIDTRYALDKLEYVGKGETLGQPLWRISTSANAYTDIDLNITVTTETIGDQAPTVQTSRCAGRIEHDLVIEIYRDGVLEVKE